MIDADITKEQMLDLVRNYSYNHIAKRILHIRNENFDKLLIDLNIKKEPRYVRKIYPIVSQDCKEFILGSLLGDMSIVRKGPQYRLSCSHCANQIDYIKHKKDILGELSLTNIQPARSKGHKIRMIVRNEWVNREIKEYNGFILHSKVHPYFTELRNRLYCTEIAPPRGGILIAHKTITEWWLNQITDWSLAYWTMDDGAVDYSDGSYVIRISTYGYTKYEHELLLDFLKTKFHINGNLQKVSRGYGLTIRFNTENSKKLRDLIEPFVPDCMQYKVDRDAWLSWKLARYASYQCI